MEMYERIIHIIIGSLYGMLSVLITLKIGINIDTAIVIPVPPVILLPYSPIILVIMVVILEWIIVI